MTRPTFLGIGAQRCGTSWLDRVLRSHPDVYLPERTKEVHYFDVHYERGPDWYAGFFPADEEAARFRSIGEITPRYLFEEEAPARIANDLPGVRVFAILRDPVDRAYSQYGLTVRDDGYRGSFEEFLEEHPDAIERGMYARQLGRYRAVLGADRVHLVSFERCMREPATELRGLAEFLSVDPDGLDLARSDDRVNPTYRIAHATLYARVRSMGRWLRNRDFHGPVNLAKRLGVRRLFGRGEALAPLQPRTRARLAAAFEPDVRSLASEFGFDTSPWNSSP